MQQRAVRQFFYRGWTILALLLCLLTAAHAQGGEAGEVVVRLQPGVAIQDILRDYAATLDDHVPGTDVYSLNVPAGTTAAAFAALLQQDVRIVTVDQNEALDAPEVGGSQMHLAYDAGPNPGIYVNQEAYQQVNLGATFSRSQGEGIIVAVLDTGATPSHPALIGHYMQGFNAISPNDPPLDLPDGQTHVATGHGTMVAGIIAYLAPKAKIMPIRVLNGDGIGKMMDVLKGIQYAIAHGARVLNMSFGTARKPAALSDTLDAALAAGVVVVASSGNDGTETAHYPAAQGETLAVTSVEADNKHSAYANYGHYIKIAAPGTGIRSTYYTGGYATWSGTSFSSPFVAAAAALVLGVNPGLTTVNVLDDLEEAATPIDKINPQFQGKLGHGLLNIQDAVFLVTPSPRTLSGSVSLEGSVNPVQSLDFVLRPRNGSPEITRTLTLGADGAFEWQGVPLNKYDLAIKGKKWLRTVVLNIDTTTASVSGVRALLRTGDANDDNTVNFDDFQILADAYFTGTGDPLFDDRADFDCNGEVNFDDFVLLTQNYFTDGDP